MANRKRNIQMKFYVTEEEKRLIEEKMAQLPTRRYGAYMRKMAIDGYTRIIPMWASLGGRDANGELLIIHCASGYNNVVITGKKGFTSIGRPQYYAEAGHS